MKWLDSRLAFSFYQVLHLYLSISSDFNHPKMHCPEYLVKELETSDENRQFATQNLLFSSSVSSLK